MGFGGKKGRKEVSEYRTKAIHDHSYNPNGQQPTLEDSTTALPELIAYYHIIGGPDRNIGLPAYRATALTI
eukprot:1349837-Amorphochlora_amoeboformis.AAC.1